jgi:integrase
VGKRGNGEGTITRRKNGGWMAQYYVYATRGRKRRTLYGKTRKEVAKKLTEALSNREQGLIFDAGKMTSRSIWSGGLRTAYVARCGPRPSSATSRSLTYT